MPNPKDWKDRLTETLPLVMQLAAGSEPVDETRLHSGSRILAGGTTFLVQLEEGRGTWTAPQPAAVPARSMKSGAAGAKAGATVPMAVEICKRYEIDEDVKPHLRGNQTADDFVQELAAHGLLRHALRFQAHRLAKRESVWWACRCVRLGCGDRLSPEDRVAVEAAEQWVRQPGDEPARAAERAAESLGYQTAGGWAAAAAFWSGESLAPPGLQAVTPAEHLTGTAVSAALILAGISEDPRKAPQRYREFLNLAAKLVRGEELWPSE